MKLNKEINSEAVFGYEALWNSMMKCKNGVMWKPSTMSFYISGVENVNRMCKQLENGTYKTSKPKPILITYPKRREGLSINFKDRVLQRSINDNVLYPSTSRSFILDNCACQKGKGTDFARKRLKQHWWNYYCNHGFKGYVLQIDISGYYPNLRHDVVNDTFRQYLNEEIYEMVESILNFQYSGEVGYNPGSQMVQIAGITVPNKNDHFIKERLHCKHYIRYMDDLWILEEDLDRLKLILEAIRILYKRIGLTLHPKKTKIIDITKDTFLFLGFKYRFTSTGKVIMTLDPQNVKHMKRKLRRMVKKAKRGEMSKETIDNSLQCWINHAMKGNSWKLVQRMNEYYKKLWEE